jgi:glycyl-tRNA synthetase beta chain
MNGIGASMTEAQDFLFELLTEELPPKALRALSRGLADGVKAGLETAGLSFAAVLPYASPRRLAVIVTDLQARQADQAVERKGPAIAAANDADGNPTKAALGFAKSCGVDIQALTTLKTDKGEWLYYQANQAGAESCALLPEIIDASLKRLPIPKLMHWGEHKMPFARPVHNVLMLLGKTVIDAEFFGHRACDQTYGHRFHHPDAITIKAPKDYVAALKKAHVLVDFDERREAVKDAVIALATKQNATAVMPDALLNEVTSIVEWPAALLGSFDTTFLSVPKEVLILSMQTNQKYFALIDEHQTLLPNFITISNIESRNPKDVIKGNERVICARFADADFFFNTDKKTPLASYLKRLNHIVFQKPLGSLMDKTERVTLLSKHIAKLINADITQTARAATLCKADLCTDMVGEFPELQGVMGRYYAQHDAEDDAVALALDEVYKPRFSGDSLAESKVGLSLALADRLDSLVGLFGIGKIPTGTKDPFALRRATLGILRMLIEKECDLDLKALIAETIKLYQDKLSNPTVAEDVWAFCQERLKHWAQSEGFSTEIYRAVAFKQLSNPLDIKRRLDAVKQFSALPEAQALSEANKRVKNILAKNNNTLQDHINDAALKEPAEKTLAKTITDKQKTLTALNYTDTLKSLASMQADVDQFFEDVMVMADEPALRDNRLALLNQLRALFLRVADISTLS